MESWTESGGSREGGEGRGSLNDGFVVNAVWFWLVSPSEDDQMESNEGDQVIIAVFMIGW